jgi:thiamine thiazole synthase
MSEKQLFAPVGEKEISRAIGKDFSEHFEQILDTDVIIVGGGPSGLVCARDLALRGVKTLIIESKNNPGGGFWVGGFLMPLATFREPSQKMLDEFGIPYKSVGKGLWGCQAPYAAAKLIVAALDAGAMLQNMTQFQDLVLRPGPEGKPRVGGIVVNWSSVALVPNHISCIDPIAMESKLVVDATGHDAWVMAKLQENGLLKLPGHGSMWIERSEELVVEHTGVAYPGVVVTGMAVATVYGLPRMGPTFGSMLLSGRRAAEACLVELGKGDSVQGEPLRSRARKGASSGVA